MPGGKITFKQREGYWDLPPALVSCGQCIGCRLERSRQWAVRCVHEAKMHERNCFITLTYSDENLPPGGTLVVKHWQDFAKRLRHRVGPFRFFHCGEYGSKTGRAHGHALIFGLDFHKTRKPFKKSGNFMLYRSDLLDEIWGHGYVNIGTLTFESAAYCARYTTEKITGKKGPEFYERVDHSTGEIINLKPPYCTMSRRPGIGKPWLEKFKTDVYPSDEVISNGKPARPPKYYDDQLDQVELDDIKAQRKKDAEIFIKHQTPERLAVREYIAKDRLKQSNRNNFEHQSKHTI